MIQDISPMQLNNHYDPAIKADDESRIVIFRGKDILLHLNEETGEMAYPRFSEITGVIKEDLVYIFGIGEEKFFIYRHIVIQKVRTKSPDFFNPYQASVSRFFGGIQYKDTASMS